LHSRPWAAFILNQKSGLIGQGSLLYET
jgi:hypothetical protein